jgi:alkanesulfonate monooxygenase SsuD/methylene tetrahydromethanopterin reductase-like flavin-dependent oxidoreductase (luciferase family)
MAVRPLQQPHPPLWCGTLSRETASWAGRHGVNMIALGPSEGIRELNDIHRSQQGEQSTASTPPFLGMLRKLVIADTDAQAYALAEPAYRRWYHSLVALWRRSGVTPPYAIDETIESAIAAGLCLVGSGATVRDQLADDLRVAGSNYVAVQPLFGCMRVEDGIASLAALDAEVIPKLGLTVPNGTATPFVVDGGPILPD